MEKKLYKGGCITVDGRMDEPEWASAQEYGGFRQSKAHGFGRPSPVDTTFKILPCEDRVYIGIKCEEPDLDHVRRVGLQAGFWNADVVEFYFCPSGQTFDMYQFAVGFCGMTHCFFLSEEGTIQPDRYAPDWKTAVYVNDEEHYWSVEAEIPLTALYMTPDNLWSDKWLVNVCRTRGFTQDGVYKKMLTAWGEFDDGYKEPSMFNPIDGFPMRPACDDIRMTAATVEIAGKDENGYYGELTVKVTNAVDGEFTFLSEYAEPVTVSLKAGSNEFKTSCRFADCGRVKVPLCLKRVGDGKEFKRFYPALVAYEPIKLRFTAPEYRTNFYPGQDYTQVRGTVLSKNAVTLHLEGPGIETQTIIPNADGSFCFDTAGFEYGDATLTATCEEGTLVKKIRRLPPTENMMTWISGGNLIVNGEPVLRRYLYATHYMGGEAFNRRYDADNIHATRKIYGQAGFIEPGRILNSSQIGETTKDVRPCDYLFQKIDEIIEANRGKDFAYYYISDEPECRDVSPVYLKYIYDHLCEVDPYHVVLTASRAADEYIDAADWFETHPYINPYNDENGNRVYTTAINKVGKFIDDIALLNRSDKCIGFLSTCFGANKNKPYPYPTLDEYNCHTWAAMIRGGKTLFPYAYHDVNDRPSLYEGTRYIFSSFEALDKLVLLGKRTVLINTMDVEAVLYDKGDEQMFVLVNKTAAPQQVTLDNLSGEWYHFRHDDKITGNSFDLKPLEVVIGTSQVKDAGLPSYQETVDLIDKLEYERTHTGSVFLDRFLDISIKATQHVNFNHKLFNGMRDNLAWPCVQKGEKFLELGLTKLKPTFSKVVVHGHNIADMDIKLGYNGELVDPIIVEKKTEEFSTSFLLKEAVSPDALRMEFHAYNAIEVYEVEAFA